MITLFDFRWRSKHDVNERFYRKADAVKQIVQYERDQEACYEGHGMADKAGHEGWQILPELKQELGDHERGGFGK
jgi:hypothetical protein